MDNEASGKYFTQQDEQIVLSPTTHALATLGPDGFAVCGAPGSATCTTFMHRVDCDECVRRVNFDFNRRNKIGVIESPTWLESVWKRVSRGRVIGGKPKPQVRPLPESEHPGLNPKAFERLREKFGQSNG